MTKDGVTVAKEIELEDPIANMGAQMVKRSSLEDGRRRRRRHHDGYRAGAGHCRRRREERNRRREPDGSQTRHRQGRRPTVVENLRKQSQEVGARHSTRSSRWPRFRPTTTTTIGKLIAEAMAKVNNEGVITVEEAKGTETHVEVVEGYAVRPRLYLGLLHDRSREDGGTAREAITS